MMSLAEDGVNRKLDYIRPKTSQESYSELGYVPQAVVSLRVLEPKSSIAALDFTKAASGSDQFTEDE